MIKGGASRGTTASQGLGAASGGEDRRGRGAEFGRGRDEHVYSDWAGRGRGVDSEEGGKGAAAKDGGRGGNAKSQGDGGRGGDATGGGVFGDVQQGQGRQVERQASFGEIGERRGSVGYAAGPNLLAALGMVRGEAAGRVKGFSRPAMRIIMGAQPSTLKPKP